MFTVVTSSYWQVKETNGLAPEEAQLASMTLQPEFKLTTELKEKWDTESKQPPDEQMVQIFSHFLRLPFSERQVNKLSFSPNSIAP